jgi:integrase
MAKKRTPGVVELQPGYWKVTVNLPASASPDGKRHRRVAYVRGGARAAEQKRADMLAERGKGNLKPRTAGAVSEYLDTFLAAKKSRVAARTYARWRFIADKQIAPSIGGKLLRDVKPKHLRDLYASLEAQGLSGTTIQKTHALLSMMYRQAVIDEDVPSNPCAKVPAPSIDTPEAHAIDEQEAATLLASLEGTSLYVPVLMLLDCGQRRGELLALHWQDLDLDAAVMVVRGAVEEDGKTLRIRETKTGRVRTVMLTTRAVAALRAHKKSQAEMRLAMANKWHDLDLVFPETSNNHGMDAGRIWRPTTFSRLFREAAVKAGVKTTLHELRHYHATALLRAGVPTRVVADRLGHSTTKLTSDTYQHVLRDSQQAAVDAYEARIEGADAE